MNFIYLDCETTSKDIYQAEIIEAYFMFVCNNNYVSEYELKAKVDQWSSDAEAVHKISYAEASLYPDKKDAYREFLKWLPKDFTFITYANKNTQYGTINYDVAILENELNLLGCPMYYLKNKYGMKSNISVHSLAKESAKKGLFTPIKGESGRDSFTQENVYKALFNDVYDAHNCINDVLALYKIHNELLRLENEQTNNFNLR